MKTLSLLPLALTGVFALALAPLPAQAEHRIAVVNLRTVFDEFYKTKAADASLKERAGELDKEKKNLVDQFQKMSEDYQKALEDANNQAISATEREKRKKAAEGKLVEVREVRQAIDQFDRQAITTLDEQERRVRTKLLEEIQAVIETHAKKGSFTLVLDTAAETRNRTPSILFSSGENDLTQAILAELNASAPAAALAPAAKEPPKDAGKPQKK